MKANPLSSCSVDAAKTWQELRPGVQRAMSTGPTIGASMHDQFRQHVSFSGPRQPEQKGEWWVQAFDAPCGLQNNAAHRIARLRDHVVAGQAKKAPTDTAVKAEGAFEKAETNDEKGAVETCLDGDAEKQHLIEERVQELEKQMSRMKTEMLEQMRVLQVKNAALVSQLAARSVARKSSLTQEGTVKTLVSAPRSGKRYSLRSTRGQSSGCGTSGNLSARRQSAATVALDTAWPCQSKDGSQIIHSQRKWWAGQRQFLLDDLYPSEIAAKSLGVERRHRAFSNSTSQKPNISWKTTAQKGSMLVPRRSSL